MSYIIRYSDSTLQPIVLENLATDDTSTSLMLYGRGHRSYGERHQTNFLRLLENFARLDAPVSPVVGQLWYDKNVNRIKAYTVWDATTDPVTYRWIGVADTATSASLTAPTSPILGQLWYSATAASESKVLYIFDGTNWIDVAKQANQSMYDELVALIAASVLNKVEKSGDDMTGLHTYHEDDTLASTFDYYTWISGGKVALGSLTTSSNPYLDFHSSGAHNDFDSRIIASGGSVTTGAGTLTVLGNLFVDKDPTAPLQVVPKRYVDSAIQITTQHTDDLNTTTNTHIDSAIASARADAAAATTALTTAVNTGLAGKLNRTGDTVAGLFRINRNNNDGFFTQINGDITNLGHTSIPAGPRFNFNTSGVAIDYDSRIYAVGGNGTIGEGSLYLNGYIFADRDPTQPLMVATKQYVDGATGGVSGKVNKSGDTMTGYLTLNGVPTANLHAATKSYVDSTTSTLSGKVNKSGDSMLGFLTLWADPTNPYHAATKNYVDARVLPFTPVQQGGGTAQTTNKVYIGWSGDSTLHLQIDSTNFGNNWPINISGIASYATGATNATNATNATFATNATYATNASGNFVAGGDIYANGSKVLATKEWVNDPAGSSIVVNNGYKRLPGNIMIQWMSCAAAGGTTANKTYTWPTAFASCLTVMISNTMTNGEINDSIGNVGSEGVRLSSFTATTAVVDFSKKYQSTPLVIWGIGTW